MAKGGDMKLSIVIDKKLADTEVDIRAREIDRDVRMIQAIAQGNMPENIVGFDQGRAVILSFDQIVRCYAEDKKVYAQSSQGVFQVRNRIYELEERFAGSSFVRISQSEIVNLKHIKSLELGFKGTIIIQFKGGGETYVSRRYAKEFKKSLGL